VCHVAQLVCRLGQWRPASEIRDCCNSAAAARHHARASTQTEERCNALTECRVASLFTRELGSLRVVRKLGRFSPVDVRTLCERHRAFDDGRLIFDRQTDGRAKTGRAAIGNVSKRTELLVKSYLAQCGAERLPDARLFRTRTGLAHEDARLLATLPRFAIWRFPATVACLWTCSGQARWKRSPAGPMRSVCPRRWPTQSVVQTSCTRPAHRSQSRRCGTRTRRGCRVVVRSARGTKRGKKYQLSSLEKYQLADKFALSNCERPET
jgi:hypothetical protein